MNRKKIESTVRSQNLCSPAAKENKPGAVKKILLSFALLGCVTGASAQEGGDEEAPISEEDVVVLSPFVVSSSEDRGYIRLKTLSSPFIVPTQVERYDVNLVNLARASAGLPKLANEA